MRWGSRSIFSLFTLLIASAVVACSSGVVEEIGFSTSELIVPHGVGQSAELTIENRGTVSFEITKQSIPDSNYSIVGESKCTKVTLKPKGICTEKIQNELEDGKSSTLTVITTGPTGQLKIKEA
jgi:hypothetical protein